MQPSSYIDDLDVTTSDTMKEVALRVFDGQGGANRGIVLDDIAYEHVTVCGN